MTRSGFQYVTPSLSNMLVTPSFQYTYVTPSFQYATPLGYPARFRERKNQGIFYGNYVRYIVPTYILSQ